MTVKRAERIRSLRCLQLNSYSSLSACVHAEWGTAATWPKEGCSEAGHVLAVLAARTLGENPYQDPWA